MSERTVVITGGAGFIGSNLVHYWAQAHPEDRIVVLDALTYAGNLGNIADLVRAGSVLFERVDLADRAALAEVLPRYRPGLIFHLAAETHVDRSVLGVEPFVRSNVLASSFLLEEVRHLQDDQGSTTRIVLVSTDEVYGPAEKGNRFDESSPYRPSSPYAASKAAADHFAGAAHRTWGLDLVIVHPTNNYGPMQFPEKLIPLMIHNALNTKPLPVYGSGLQERDWLFVADTCRGLDLIADRGRTGQHYNLGTERETPNQHIVETIADSIDERMGRSPGTARGLVTHIEDRPGHDVRYALDCSLVHELGWDPKVPLEQGLKETIDWYIDNRAWLDDVTSGAYKNYYEEMYASRIATASQRQPADYDG